MSRRIFDLALLIFAFFISSMLSPCIISFSTYSLSKYCRKRGDYLVFLVAMQDFINMFINLMSGVMWISNTTIISPQYPLKGMNGFAVKFLNSLTISGRSPVRRRCLRRSTCMAIFISFSFFGFPEPDVCGLGCFHIAGSPSYDVQLGVFSTRRYLSVGCLGNVCFPVLPMKYGVVYAA